MTDTPQVTMSFHPAACVQCGRRELSPVGPLWRCSCGWLHRETAAGLTTAFDPYSRPKRRRGKVWGRKVK